MRHVVAPKQIELRGGGGNPPALQATLDEVAIGPPAHRHIGERVGDAERRGERPIHRPLAGSAGQHQRAVDVEEDEPGSARHSDCS